MNDISFLRYMDEFIEHLKEENRNQSANSYSSAMRQFVLFTKGRDVLLSDIDGSIITSFRDYLASNNMSENTVVYYLSAIRAVYNRAVKLKLVVNKFPFEDVSTRISVPKHLALSENELSSIRLMDLSDNYALAFARDMFMLSFYFRGLSYYDMSQLKKSNVINGELRCEKKDGELFLIELEPVMMDIIERYQFKTMGSDYLLPIITGSAKDSDNYFSAVRLINIRLKKIAKMLNISISLTSATARHSWAMIALSKGLSKKIIGRCLGYKNAFIAEKYLDDLENVMMTNISRIVINEVSGTGINQ